MRPLFSVIISTYGRPAFLRDAVRSVLAQTVEDLECIVVDDCSPIPAKLENGDKRLRVIRRRTNGGQAAAINTGLGHSKGRYVAILDDDDLFTSKRLELALEGLKKAPVTVCWSTILDSGEKRLDSKRTLNGWVYDMILDDTTPNLGATAFQRDLDLFFDDSLVASADLDWWLRVSKMANVETIAEIGHLYRKHDGPRNLNSTRARIETSMWLLSRYSDYFESHPRATAHRWTRIGLMWLRLGEKKTARSAFLRALRFDPTFRRAWHLMRSLC